MFAVAPGIWGVRTLWVNAYLVRMPRGSWVLVDGGMAAWQRSTLATARRLFGAQAPAAVFLTHGHFDHVGAVPAILQRWPQTPVYVHPLEEPYVTGRQSYPAPDVRAGGGLLTRLSSFFRTRPYDFGPAIRPLPRDGSVPGLDGWRWFHGPGHTPGQVAFFRLEDRVLLAGDVMTTVRQESLGAVLRQTPEVRPPPAYFTIDWHLTEQSMRELAAMEPQLLATGHGAPMRGEVLRGELNRLLVDFARRGLPRGRLAETKTLVSQLPLRSSA